MSGAAGEPVASGPGSAVDRFGRSLGFEHLDPSGRATLRVTVTADHLNGAGIAHGGLLFAALDEAVAIVANRAQPVSVTTTGTLHFLRPVFAGDVLEAVVEPVRAGRQLAVYDARLERDGELVAYLVAQTIPVAPRAG